VGTSASLPDATIVSIVPGAEIINLTGNLTLGTNASTGTSDWNLGSATYRFGSKSVPGVLTLRAANNLVFLNALSDGFNITNATRAFQAQMLAYNPLLRPTLKAGLTISPRRGHECGRFPSRPDDRRPDHRRLHRLPAPRQEWHAQYRDQPRDQRDDRQCRRPISTRSFAPAVATSTSPPAAT